MKEEILNLITSKMPGTIAEIKRAQMKSFEGKNVESLLLFIIEDMTDTFLEILQILKKYENQEQK